MEILRQARITGSNHEGNGGEAAAPRADDLNDVAEFYARAFDKALHKVRARLAMLTPEWARELLDRDDPNRPRGFVTPERYCNYILRGLWWINGEPIILGDDGRLLDGQNRCDAVVRAGIAIPVLVVEGIDPEAFKSLNQGKIRSAADALFIFGQKRQRALAGALSWLGRYETNSMLGRIVRPSNEEYIRLYQENPGMADSVEYVFPRAKKGKHPAGTFSFLHYVCLRRHPGHGAFFEQVFSGAGFDAGSPAHKLDQWIQHNKAGAKTVELLAIAAKAWNASILGKRVGVLKWMPSEGFPEIA